MEEHCYVAIDLKSFYASVECRERGLDPLDTNLVVADPTRTEKTICLAVSPSLKAYGIPGRARLFEAVEAVRKVNLLRRANAPNREFTGKSSSAKALAADPSLELDYIVAPPRMAYYMQYSTQIYQIYMKYAAPEDIHVYSIDEVFIDATDYIRTLGISGRDYAMLLIHDVLASTGITATAGVGTNLYLAKIAMDVVAKHIPADKDGVRIAELDERKYRRELWSHRPITDFWRVGKGIAARLERNGMYTMGDIARCSLGKPNELHNEELLYRLFGINAELLIDHAWGFENCRLCDIKAYRPANHSISSGQVLATPYDHETARIIVREMTDALVLELVEKRLVCSQVSLAIGYDTLNMRDKAIAAEVKSVSDRYGREMPKEAHGSARLPRPDNSTAEIMEAMLAIYDRVVDPLFTVRRVTVVAEDVISEAEAHEEKDVQLDLFTDEAAEEARRTERATERKQQQVLLDIKKKYGKNAILRGTNLQKGATMRERNRQIGGHKA